MPEKLLHCQIELLLALLVLGNSSHVVQERQLFFVQKRKTLVQFAHRLRILGKREARRIFRWNEALRNNALRWRTREHERALLM